MTETAKCPACEADVGAEDWFRVSFDGGRHRSMVFPCRCGAVFKADGEVMKLTSLEEAAVEGTAAQVQTLTDLKDEGLT